MILQRRCERFRAVGIACVAAFLIVMLLHGKAYYAGPIYPTLIAAGAVVVQGIDRPRLGAAVRWDVSR